MSRKKKVTIKKTVNLLLIIFTLIFLAINTQIMKKDERPKIYALGDSLTLGAGSKGKNYPEKLAELLGQEVINKGVQGDTTEMILKRLNFSDGEFVIVWGGINDIYREVPLEVTEKNLQLMYDKIHSSGGKVITINITPSKGDGGWSAEKQLKTKELNTWITKSNADYKIDAYSLLENCDTLKGEYDFGDHLHLTQTGYFTVAFEVFNIFSQQIKPSSDYRAL